MAQVKICGINSAAAMDAACANDADWIGFVFVPRSPRAVTPEQAEDLHFRHRGGPLRVGLFVDADEQAIEDALDAVPLDALQIYAAPERCAELRATFGIATWRALGVATQADLPDAPEALDAYVLDAAAADAALPGGNASQFDYALLHGWQPKLPWLLAGGLKPANVAAAIAASGARAVDVSSGVETSRGVKDPALIAAFIAAAREG